MCKNKFVSWVNTHRQHHSEKEKYNFVCLRGGKFNITDSTTFFKLFKDYVKLSQTNAFPLVFRGPREKLTPFYLDVDLELEEDVSIPTGVFIEMTHQFLVILKEVLQTNEVWKVVISRRTGSYWKDNLRCFKNGFHVLIQNLRVTPNVMTRFRTALLADGYWYTLLREFKIRNKPESVIDVAITTRRNGLLLLGLNKLLHKKNGPCSAHYVCYFDTWRTIWFGNMEPLSFGWQFENKNKNEEYKEILEMAYGWVFGHDYTKTEVPAPVSAPISPISTVSTEGSFNLPYFLQLLGNNTLPHTEWKQLVAFCKGHGLNKTETCKLLNDHCSPKDLHENERMFQHAEATGPCLVGKGSIVRMLRNFQVDFDSSKLFPGEIYKYHNESRMFDSPGKVWKRAEIQTFFSQVYAYTWGGGATEFIYKEKRQRRFGNDYYTTVNTIITGMPFSTRETDKLILIEPTEAQLRSALAKVAKQKIPRSNQELQLAALTRVNRAKELLDNGTLQQLVEFLGDDLEPKEVSLGSLFLKTKQRGLLPRRYHSYTIEPFLYEDKTPNEIVNIFPGFEMMRFANDPSGIKSTPFWHWLWVVWANRVEYKMEWLLSYFATKLQFPAKKVNKYLIGYGRKQGVGKTSVRKFTEAIFDVDKVLFCESVDDYMQPENSEFIGKMFCIIDDLDILTKAQSSALKSKVTSTTFKYKELYKNKKTLPSYLDLIGTSNSEKPAFVEADCRRTELAVINPELQNNKKFWNQFYASAEDTRNCGMWFSFLANYKIQHDVGSKDCRFDSQALQVQKVHSMKLVHKFVVTFFEDPECFEGPCKQPRFANNWFSKLKFFTLDGQKAVFIAKQRLYDSFQWWRKKTGQNLNAKLSTFVDGLADVGVDSHRRICGDHKLTGFLFVKPIVQKGLKCYYKLDSLRLAWCWVCDSEFQEYSLKTWRFRTPGHVI